jgi:hypothetical protein
MGKLTVHESDKLLVEKLVKLKDSRTVKALDDSLGDQAVALLVCLMVALLEASMAVL